MKKIIITSLFLVIGTASFSQDAGVSDALIVDALIRKNLNKNFESIQQKAYSLSDSERAFLYNQHEMKWQAGVGINCAISYMLMMSNFGIGNFYQGDYVGGYITLIGSITGAGLAFIGLLGSTTSADSSRDSSSGSSYSNWGPVILVGGVTLYLSSGIFGIVRAYFYPQSYNKKLKESLHISKAVTYDIAPEFAVTPKGADITLIRIRF